MTEKDKVIFRAGDQLSLASNILEDLGSLFSAIRKLGSAEAASLARIGQGITEMWCADFAADAEKLFAVARKEQGGDNQ